MRRRERLWDAVMVLAILHTYCAMHCGEWAPWVSLLALATMVTLTVAVIVALVVIR